MAANMQQMAGPGGMMPQRQNNNMMQMQEYLHAAIKNHHDQGTWMGWQSQVDPKERVIKVQPLVSNMALASAPSLDWIKAAEHSLVFERELFMTSPDKQNYDAALQNKIQFYVRKRQENAGALQNSVHAQAQQQQQQQQQFMMNQAMQQNRLNQNMGQNPQHNLQHLQFQMQNSQQQQQQQQQQMGMNMAGNGGPPVGPNQQMFQTAGQQRPPGMMDGAQAQLPLDQAKVMELAQRLASQVPPAQKETLRNHVRSKFPDRALEFESNGKDPVMIWFQHSATQTLRKGAAAAAAQRQATGMPLNANAQSFGRHPMAQGGRGHMNPNMLTPGAQQQAAAAAAANGGEFGSQFNMGDIVNQQKAGILAQQEGQMVVPASNAANANRNATPQPNAGMQGQQAMPNQQGPNQTPRPPQAQQQFNMQQAQQQAQQQQAHLRAQQLRQLQGQQAGLAGGMPNSQSPGMNTLNTPMRRPPSAMNGADGQGSTQQPNQFPTGLDPRFNQGNQRQLPPNIANSQLFQTMMAQMTPEQRHQISLTPADKLHEVMARWQENQRQLQMKAMAQAGNPMHQMGGAGQGQQPGQFNPANIGNQMQMPNGMMQQQGPGNMNAQSQMILAQQQQMLQRVRQQPQASLPPQQMSMMDQMDIPPPMLMTMQTQIGAPPEVRKWKQLKVWAEANLPPQTREQLLVAQKKHWLTLASKNFEQRKREQQQQQQQPQPGMMGQPQPPTPGALQQQMQLQAQAQAQAQAQSQQMPGQQMQGGMQPGVNLNQMPQQRPGMPPNMAAMSQFYQQITPQQIQAARASNEKLAGYPDDQIRNLMMATMHKQQQLKQQQQQQAGALQQGGPPMRQQQPNQQQMNQMGMPQPAAPQQQTPQPPAATPKAPTPQFTPAQAATANKQPAPDNKAAAANARNAANNRPAPKAQPAQSPATGRKNLKRPSPDDTTDAAAAGSNDNSQQSRPQPMAQDPRQQMGPKMVHLTPEQLAKLPQEQRAKYEQVKRAQEQQQADMERLRQIGQEVRNSRNEVMPEVSMNAQERSMMGLKLQKLKDDMGKIGRVLGKWYGSTHDDARARDYFRTRIRLMHQFQDGEHMAVLKERFTLRISDLDEASKLLQSMVIDCANMSMSKQHPGTRQGGQPTPLSAANLEKQTQALSKAQHQRSNSKSGQAPAAPTTTAPPFPFGAASPHGQPSYAGKPMVSRDNLNLPPRKKQKAGEHPTPPQGEQPTPSPQISKTVSPEMKMKMPPAKPAFKCPDPDCEMASSGFPTDAALQTHIQEDHVKPMEDPIKFMQENLAAALGLDAASVQKLQAAQAVKQGQTPASNPSTTPMSRMASIQQGKGGAKGSADNGSADKQGDSNGATGAPETWASNTIDPSLFQRFGTFEFGHGGVFTDIKAWQSLTPNDTPESMKDSGSSEPNSDVPEKSVYDVDIDWRAVESGMLVDKKAVSAHDADASFHPGLMDDMVSGPPSAPINWDDVQIDFDKPFVMDTSLFSLNVS